MELGLISPEDLTKIVSGGIKESSKEEDTLSVKVCLELINLFTNIHVIRKDATQSALRYLFTNSKENDYDGNLGLKRKSTFNAIDTNDDEDGAGGSKLSKIDTRVVNKGCSKVNKTIIVETTVSDYEPLDVYHN